MYLPSGSTAIGAVLVLALTARRSLAIDCSDGPTYELGFDGQTSEEAHNDINKFWRKDEKDKFSHFSRAVSMAFAYTNRDAINRIFKYNDFSKLNSLSFRDLQNGNEKDLIIGIHEVDHNNNLANMVKRNITITMSAGDFPKDTAENVKYIWPLLLHKINAKLEVEEGITSIVMQQEDNDPVNCEDMPQGDEVCGIGSLLARLTGVPMRCSYKLTPLSKLDDYLQASAGFPVLSLTRDKHAGILGKMKKETWIPYQYDMKSKMFMYRTPDPSSPEIRDHLAEWVGDPEGCNSYLVYPANYQQYWPKS